MARLRSGAQRAVQTLIQTAARTAPARIRPQATRKDLRHPLADLLCEEPLAPKRPFKRPFKRPATRPIIAVCLNLRQWRSSKKRAFSRRAPGGFLGAEPPARAGLQRGTGAEAAPFEK